MSLDTQQSEDILTEDEFCKELINRFFNSNSYFYHCITKELDSLQSEDTTAGNNQDYLLFGSLIDRLVATNDAATELKSLAHLRGFDEFCDNLLQGIRYLREANLDSDKMKVEIEGLAHSLINSAFLALQFNETRRQFEGMLGIAKPDSIEHEESTYTEEPQLHLEEGSPENAAPESGNADPEEEESLGFPSDGPSLKEETSAGTTPRPSAREDGPSCEDADLGIPSSAGFGLTDSLLSMDDRLDASPGPVETTEAEADIQLTDNVVDHVDESQSLFSELSENEAELSSDEFIPSSNELEFDPASPTKGEQETDLSLETENEFQVPAGEGHDPFTPVEAETEHNLVEGFNRLDQAIPSFVEDTASDTIVSEEPASVIGAFRIQVQSKLDELDELLRDASDGPKNITTLGTCGDIFESVAMDSMIYGFEAFEQICSKSRRLVSLLRKDSKYDYPEAIALLIDATGILRLELDKDPERVDFELVRELGESLMAPTKCQPYQPKEPPQLALIPPEKGESDEEVSEQEPNVTSSSISGESNIDVAEFKLPGEDDTEILNLIKEISGQSPSDESSRESSEEKQRGIFSNPLLERVTETDDVPTEACEEAVEPLEFENLFSTDLEPDRGDQGTMVVDFEGPLEDTDPIEPSEDTEDGIVHYKKEAKLYFSVIEEALAILGSRSDDASAIEDLELATESLHGLTLKLNLDRLGEYLSPLSDLIENMVRGGMVNSDGVQLLQKAFKFLMELKSVEEIEKREPKEIVALAESYNAKIRNRFDQY